MKKYALPALFFALLLTACEDQEKANEAWLERNNFPASIILFSDGSPGVECKKYEIYNSYVKCFHDDKYYYYPWFRVEEMVKN